MGYSTHALKGSGYNSLVKVLTVLATAAKIYVLARLLSPNDFGLFQYVIIALGLLEAVTETGINTTIIQSKKNLEYFLDTAWVISIIRGLVMSILLIILGFAMSWYFHEERLLVLTAVASFIPLIKGFINPSVVTFYQQLRFIEDSVYRFSLIVVDAVAAIVFALFFHSVYVMVFSMMAAALFEVGISFFFFGTRPRFHALKSRALEIYANGKGLNISSILGYLVENVDNLLVGKVVGTSALGIYSNAYALSHKFNLQFAKSVQFGTFPIYVMMANQKERLRRAFWKATTISLGAFFAASLPFLLFPHWIVLVFLGEKWLEVVPILRPLVIAGMLQSFITLSVALFTATRRYDWLNLSLFVNVTTLVLFVVILGQHYGLMGSVMGVLLSRTVVMPFSFYGIWRTFADLEES
jgi:PST family polysaccharide transporter